MPTSMRPVWQRSPHRLHSAVGLTEGLIKLGNLDEGLRDDETFDCGVGTKDVFVAGSVIFVMFTANGSRR